MNRIYILFFSLFILTSCGNKRDGEQKTGLLSNFVSISDNEDKGVKEILGFYGGYCEYSIGVSASTEDGKKKYFELKMSQSDAIEKLADKIEMPASNIAYLFYRNLKDEKENYDEIHSVIIFKDGTEKTFEYSTKQLETVHKRMNVVNKVVELINSNDFDTLKSMLNNELVEFNKDELITNLENANPKLGKVTEFNPYGFRINNSKSGIEILHVSGAMIREIQNNAFSVDLDLNSEKEEIYLLQYKL
ncbi:hypothetical protein KZY98_12940 [Croceibacter atlanticus]|uniref:hypothetical protein n=1 Tax=Croceibacter atlanticus TaxID=313588 RepID=UPI001C5DA10B|nr:hypothetical protein [Croceibacter atlanticus]MBW4971372.1 hypothetical protein [Croceibacter atlanticus]